jgi:hypothetical protein
MNFRSFLCGLPFMAVALRAHPGHEPFSEGLKHFVSSPNHFFPPLIFGAVLFLTARFLPRRGERVFVKVVSLAIVTVTLFS